MKLKKRWLESYQSAITKMAKESPYYSEFKLLVRQHLYGLQSRNLLPSRSDLIDALPQLMDEAERNTTFGRIDDQRMDGYKMDQALQEMMFTPVVTDHDERGQLDGPWLKVFGIVSTSLLSRREISYIERTLGAKEDKGFSAIRITLVSLPISKPVKEGTQDRINHFGLRVARELLFHDATLFPVQNRTSRRNVGERVRQWWTFQTV